VGRENIAIANACQKQNRIRARRAATGWNSEKNPMIFAVFALRPTVKITTTWDLD
jgi:hypothetical protein